jgi:hypothetical protein
MKVQNTFYFPSLLSPCSTTELFFLLRMTKRMKPDHWAFVFRMPSRKEEAVYILRTFLIMFGK